MMSELCADIWKRESLPDSIKEVWDHDAVGHIWLDTLRQELHRLNEYINAHQLIVNQFAYHDGKYWWKGDDLNEMKRKSGIFDAWEKGRCGYFKPGYGCDSPTGIGKSVMCRKLPNCEVLTDELLWKQVKAARDKLYEELPSGDIDSFALLKVVQIHIAKLDEILEDIVEAS